MRRVGALVAACAALAACGGDSESQGAPALSGDSLRLTARLQEATATQIATIDLDLAREQLGLPDDADPAYAMDESLDSLSDESRRLKSFVDMVIGGPLSGLSSGSGRLREAIDLSQVSEATSYIVARPTEEAVALRTTQTFDEIASELQEAGYQRDGDLLVDEHADLLSASVYLADTGDGGILLTTSRASAEAAAARESAVSEDLLAQLDGVEGAMGFAIVPTDPLAGEGCVDAVAVAEDVGPPYAGELALRVRRSASPERFTPPNPEVGPAAARLAVEVEFGTPAADDEWVTVPFRFVSEPDPDGSATTGFILPAIRETRLDAFYDCD